jgi:hypothetical protein
MTERAWRPGEVRSGRFGGRWSGLDEPGWRGPRGGSGGNAGAAARGLRGPKIVTAERREASAPIARCAPRLNRAAQNEYAPVGAPPSPRGWQQEEGSNPGARQAPRERRELRFERNCSSKSKEWVPGTPGTGLFDIVNGVRCASPRAQPGDGMQRDPGKRPGSRRRDSSPFVALDPIPRLAGIVARRMG